MVLEGVDAIPASALRRLMNSAANFRGSMAVVKPKVSSQTMVMVAVSLIGNDRSIETKSSAVSDRVWISQHNGDKGGPPVDLNSPLTGPLATTDLSADLHHFMNSSEGPFSLIPGERVGIGAGEVPDLAIVGL